LTLVDFRVAQKVGRGNDGRLIVTAVDRMRRGAKERKR